MHALIPYACGLWFGLASFVLILLEHRSLQRNVSPKYFAARLMTTCARRNRNVHFLAEFSGL